MAKKGRPSGVQRSNEAMPALREQPRRGCTYVTGICLNIKDLSTAKFIKELQLYHRKS
jgi:hypothetical protein